MHRRSFLLAASAAATLPLPALAQNSRAKTLRFVPQANLSVLDPIVTTATVATVHGYCVFDTLFGVDDKLRPQPQMASGADVQDGGLTWVIKLRDGLRFHDGHPVLARDCIASLQRWAQRDSFGQALAAVVNAWEAPDDRTLRIRLKKPFPHMLDALAKTNSSPAFIMPERLAKIDGMTPITEMVGSGPWRFKADEYVSGAKIVYTRFEGYNPRPEPAVWTSGGKRVHFDRLEWIIMPDIATAVGALQSGEVDWVEQVQNDLLPVLKNNPALHTGVLDPFGLISGMRFNFLQPPFNNVKLRQAVLSAVNQADYLEAINGDNKSSYRECFSMFPCGVPGFSEAGASLMTPPRNLDKARQAVKDSGYAGERVVIINPTDQQYIGPLGLVTADLLKKLGMNVDLQSMDWGTVIQRRTSKEPVEKGGWSIFHTNWPGASVTNPAANTYIRGQGEKGWFGWYKNDDIERLTSEWLDAQDAAAAAKINAEIQKVAFDTVPIVPLGQYFSTSGMRKNLQGILQCSASLFWNVQRT